jgi:hypothetical protein
MYWMDAWVRLASAVMVMGEVTLAPLAGEETQTDPAALEPGLGGGRGGAEGNGCGPASARVTVGQETAEVPEPPEPPEFPELEVSLPELPQPLPARVARAKSPNVTKDAIVRERGMGALLKDR